MTEKQGVFKDSKISAAAEDIKSAVIAHTTDTVWHQVKFMHTMRIAWDWNDLFEDATTAGENLNLTIAGLVLSNNVEFAAREGEAVLRQLGFDEIRSEHYLLSTDTRNQISRPALRRSRSSEKTTMCSVRCSRELLHCLILSRILNRS